MARGVVDYEGMQGEQADGLRGQRRPAGLPFEITKIGHVVVPMCPDDDANTTELGVDMLAEFSRSS